MMKWLLGLIALALLGGVWLLWDDGSAEDEKEETSISETRERELKSRREKQLADVRTRATRVLSADSAQKKIEDFLNEHGGIRSWDQETVRAFNELAYHWGVIDPRGAMAYVGSLNGPADSTKRERLTAQILRAWGLVDHEAALAWFKEPGQEREKDSQTLVNVVQGMFGADRKAVDEFLLNLPESEWLVNQTYIDRVARMHFYRDGLEKATEWVRAFPDEKIKARAFHKIADDLAARDPREAAEWITRHAGDIAAEMALRSVASDLTRAEGIKPDEVAKWARSLPASEGRGEALAVSVASWAGQEPVEAGEFLKTLPPGEEKDKVVARFAPAVAKMNPEVAIEWAGTISDQAKQDETMIRSLVRWAIVDQGAAKTWLETAEVTPAVREAMSKSRYFGNSDD